MNTGLELSLARLQPVKEEFGAGLTWADLIVLAGTTALEAGMQVTRLDISTISIISKISRYINNIYNIYTIPAISRNICNIYSIYI